MLTQDQRAIVTATVPILEQGGEALTRHFYKGLFRDYPEVAPYFNQAHQHSGEQQRAKGLVAQRLQGAIETAGL